MGYLTHDIGNRIAQESEVVKPLDNDSPKFSLKDAQPTDDEDLKLLRKLWAQALEKYGAIPKGENPVRSVPDCKT